MHRALMEAYCGSSPLKLEPGELTHLELVPIQPFKAQRMITSCAPGVWCLSIRLQLDRWPVSPFELVAAWDFPVAPVERFMATPAMPYLLEVENRGDAAAWFWIGFKGVMPRPAHELAEF